MVSVTTLFLYAQPSVIPEWENIVTFCPKHPIKWDQNLQFIYMIYQVKSLSEIREKQSGRAIAAVEIF